MRGPVRSVWDEPRPPHPPPRGRRDWVLVGVLVPVAALEGALRPELPWRAVTVVVTVGLVATVLWRRSRPLLMVGLVFGAAAVAALSTGGEAPEMYAMAYVLLLPYALFRWGSGRDITIGSAIVLVKVGMSAVFGQVGPADAIGELAVLLAVVALGLAFRYRARARMRELDQVKLLERERLARDLHDTVAHHVSAMAIRAQAGLAAAATQPAAAAEALRVIEAEASRTLAEMRAMVRTLRRNQPVDLAAGPRVTDLTQLAGRSRAGPTVEVELAGDLDDLPPSVGSATYRLAQESVTNARRHARHASRVTVHVATDDRSVRLQVSDDGEPGSARANVSPPGYGLIGMFERADMVGGTLRAGPNPDRGWTVTAVLPRTGTPA